MTIYLSQSELKRRLHYDPDTGEWVRLFCGNRTDLVGTKAGSIKNSGYRFIDVDGERYFACKLAFLFMEGFLPETVDHKNRNRADDRWCNLRVCTRSENQCNTETPFHNTSGVKGVHYNKAKEKWTAYININKKRIHLGSYQFFNDAVTVRQNAEIQYHKDFRPEN